MTKNKFSLLFIFLSLCLNSWAQGTHVTRFNFSDYNGGHENWDICKIGTNLAIANQQGLLLFQNGNWNINIVPEDIAPKAVYYQNNKLYTAFGSRFGYFNIKDYTITGNFHPITLPQDAKLFNQVWKIVSNGEQIYFQTDKNVIVVKDTAVVKTLSFTGFERCIFEINKDIYFVDKTLGLLKNFKPIPYGDSLKNKEVKVILPIENGSLLISNYTDNTFLKYNSTGIHAIFDKQVISQNPLCGVKTKNGFFIGTKENGVYELSEKGEILNHFNKDNYLAFNRVLALYLDENNSLWLGLENGLERFRFDLPYKNIGFDNVFGNSTNIESIDSNTFFLTSNGIYTCKTEEIFSNKKDLLQLWNNTNGPQCFIRKFGDSYLYGHLKGLSEYKNGNTKRIIDGNCTGIKKINDQYFLVKVEKDWVLFHQLADSIQKVKTLDLPSKFIVLEDKLVWNYGNEIMVQNFSYDLNLGVKQNFKIRERIERLFLKNDTLFFTNSHGTFFIKSTNQKNIVAKKYSERTIYKVDFNKTNVDAIKLNRELFYDSNFKLQNQCSNFIFEILKINRDKISFIKQLNDSLFAMGTYRGFTIINSKNIKNSHSITLVGFKATFNQKEKKLETNTFNNQKLYFYEGNLSIDLQIKKHFYPMIPLYKYKYFKDGEWIHGEWQEEQTLELTNLKTGDYEIWIESKDWFGNIDEANLGRFSIEKEHPLNLIIKLCILFVILLFLLAALRTALTKKKEHPYDSIEKE